MDHQYLQQEATNGSTTCSIMSLYNLMYPRWHPIPCNKSLAVDVICMNPQFYQNTPLTSWKSRIKSAMLQTHLPCILLGRLCFYFGKHSQVSLGTQVTNNKTKKVSVLMQNICAATQIQYLFFSVRSESPQYFLCDLLTKQITESSTQPQTSQTPTLDVIQETIEVQRFDVRNASHRLYECLDGKVLSVQVVFDEAHHCGLNSDKLHSQCFRNGTQHPAENCHTNCKFPHCRCQKLFYHTTKGECLPFDKGIKNAPSHKGNQAVSKQAHIVKHQSNKANSSFLLDCTQAELEGVKNQSFGEPCDGHGKLPCTSGCNRCYSASNLCMYEVGPQGEVMHCPSGSHLRYCKEMECKHTFKCKNSYCIPYR